MRAFTLVEMSIVLIIIGLIVAGIAKGKDMIRAGQVMFVVSDIQKIKMAVRLYDDKYDYMPGDHPIAYDYWGASCAANANDCNGDGDRAINSEGYMAWRHLNLAGLYPGNYTGSYWPSTTVIGLNVPGSSVDGGGFQLTTFDNKNSILFGSVADSRIVGGIITPAEAQSIDRKIDDSNANTGKVIGGTGLGASQLCVNASWNVPPNVYRLSNDKTSCLVYFIMD